MTKTEIEGILAQPFSMLSRHDMQVRKLLSKFHDNTEATKRSLVEAVSGFDVHLAERVRAKHKETWSKEEREWVSLDKVLHPEVKTAFGLRFCPLPLTEIAWPARKLGVAILPT